jgi:hypothetical protein
VHFATNLTHHCEEDALCGHVGMIGPEALFLEMVISLRILPSLINVSAIRRSMAGTLPSVGGLRAL